MIQQSLLIHSWTWTKI